MLNNLNCILVLPESVKSLMKSNVSDLAIYGVEIIEDIRELRKDMLATTNKVVIVGKYKYDGLSDLKLFKELLELEYFYIGDDSLLTMLLSKIAKCYLLDYTQLSSNMIYSVLYEDKGEQSKYIISTTALTDYDRVKSMLENTNSDELKFVCDDYLRLRDLLQESLVYESEYRDRISNLESRLLQHVREIDVLSSEYEDLLSKIIKQNKVLKSYRVILTKDLFSKVQSSRFKKKPKVLYFKEYSDMIHEGSFLRTLFNTFKIQGNLSCKVVRLHNSDDLFRIKSLEDKYTVISNEFLESDIVSSDFILSYGNYHKLFELLLQNKSGLDILIVLDCKKHPDVILQNSDIIPFNICRSMKDFEVLGLSVNNTICNNSDSALSWDTYDEYTEIENEGDKFIYLSSRPIIRRIYNIVRG